MTDRPSRLPAALIVVVGLAIAAVLWHVRNNFPFDDTYITFRYAANLAHGYGIVWNPGRPHTEGYTNFLYVLLLTPFSVLGWDLVAVSQIVNVIAVIVTAVAIYRMVVAGFSLRRGSGNELTGEPMQSEPRSLKAAATTAIALLYLNPITWANAFTGMETVLFAMFVVLAVASEDTRWQFVFATLATLTRPEGAMLGAIILMTNIKLRMTNDKKGIRHSSFVIRHCLFFFVLPLALYAIWKYWYFGDLLPNSFYVKVTQTGKLLAGLQPVKEFVIHVWYLFALAAYALYVHRTRVTIALFAWAVALTFFFCFVQPLQGVYDRFEFSAEVCLIALVPFAFARVSFSSRSIAIVCTFLVAFSIVWNFVEREMTHAFNPQPPIPVYTELAALFRTIPHHEQITFCWSDAGELPYLAGMRHLDPVGLNTTPIAHMKTWQEVDHYIAAARPEIIFIPYQQRTDTILTGAHGLIGKGYAALMREPELATYKPLRRISNPWIPYDIVLYVDSASVHYADIKKALGS